MFGGRLLYRKYFILLIIINHLYVSFGYIICTGGIFGSFAGGLDDHVMTSKVTQQVYTLDDLMRDLDGKHH